MKRILSIFLAVGMAMTSLSAQEPEKKQYLPEEGDWAIGFDAKPVLDFVGNLFNGDSDNTVESIGGEPTLSTIPTVSFMGKYMLTDELALKANVGLYLDNQKDAYYINDDAASVLDPLSQSKVSDRRTTRRTGVSLMAGVEYRVGKKRIQGVFGGGLVFGVDRTLVRYSYGNEMTTVNQKPTTAFPSVYQNNYRTLKSFSNQPDVFAGIAGSAGVEFFVAPKIALGAEVSLLAGYRINRQTYTVSEGYNSATELIDRRTDLVNPMTGEFSLKTDNLGGSLYLAFYF